MSSVVPVLVNCVCLLLGSAGHLRLKFPTAAATTLDIVACTVYPWLVGTMHYGVYGASAVPIVLLNVVTQLL